jgi:frataxin
LCSYSNLNSKLTFDYISNKTLESLNDKFDELSDEYSNKLSNEYDVNYSNGVLTVKVDSKYGTYVINKQTPNLQIWLSSPLSGPKRYDFINNRWIYKHDGESLHSLLTREISEYLKENVDFSDCAFATEDI